MLKQCNCELVEHSFDVVAEGQMKTCPQRIGAYNKILETLKNDSKNIQDACHILTTYRKQQRQLERIKHPVRSFKNIIKKIVNANSTSKCKITKCFCKSTPLVLRNSISFLVSH